RGKPRSGVCRSAAPAATLREVIQRLLPPDRGRMYAVHAKHPESAGSAESCAGSLKLLFRQKRAEKQHLAFISCGDGKGECLEVHVRWHASCRPIAPRLPPAVLRHSRRGLG